MVDDVPQSGRYIFSRLGVFSRIGKVQKKLHHAILTIRLEYSPAIFDLIDRVIILADIFQDNVYFRNGPVSTDIVCGQGKFTAIQCRQIFRRFRAVDYQLRFIRG